jgi:hypothetical protein
VHKFAADKATDMSMQNGDLIKLQRGEPKKWWMVRRPLSPFRRPF